MARSHGLEIFDVQLRREPIGMVLRVVIDRPDTGGVEAIEDSVGIDECQRVSQDLSALLDVEDEFGQNELGDQYTLEVSSPGLDRPLRKAADFTRFAGSKVDVKMRTRDESGRKRFTGLLRGAADGVAMVEVDGREVALRLDEIDRARLVPDLKKK